MSSLLSAELAATCNALGYFDAKTSKYYADSNTLETAKDLIRYLRRDDESHDIRRQLGETKVLQTDLLPLIKNYWEDTELFDVILRLLVNLTTPALMLWQEEVPTERAARNHYLQIEDHLQCYKQAFADEGVWAVFSKRISKTLEIEFSERGDENSLIIERILILMRNVLYVPADPDLERRPDSDASIHDQVLWALHQSAMLDIILYISSSITEQAYYMHILEILSFMLREQSALELANAALQRSQTEKLRDQTELMAIRQRENMQKQQKSRAFTSTRHSRFAGTYVVTTMKGVSDNELIAHKPLSTLDDLNFDADKQRVRPPKNRRPVQSTTTERRSAFSIRLFLKEFCIEFLNGAYNTLMYETKRTLIRAKAQAHDESYYLWAIRFFMEFNRCYKFEVKLVSETMAVQVFHYVQQQMEKYFDMIQTDKKKIPQWSRRLHLALLAYRELLMTLCAMDKSPDESVKQSSKVIKSNIFYVLEYRELILTLLLTFDELKMSDRYLKDLLETQHTFLKMLEGYCNFGEVVVQSKSTKKKKKSGKTKKSSRAVEPNVDVDALWDETSPQLSAVLEGNAEIPKDLVPFDATSDVPIDDQKAETMKNIQKKLRNNEFEDAIGLLRAAREVWPENDCFGTNNMPPDEEFLALRDIFFADLGVEPEKVENEPQSEQESDNDDNEEEEESQTIHISESDFKFEDFAKRLANQKVVRACGLALRCFDKNSTNTNHCIIKLLHRIAWDLKMPAMVFQVSIFRTFQRIYDLKDVAQYKEFVKFANYIVKEFIKVTETNPKVYMEALFFKNSKDAYDVEQGYGCYHEKSQAATKAWTEIQEDELRRLFMEHQERQIDEDVVDWIVGNLIDNTRNRRQVLKKLKEMYLLTDYKGAKKSGVSKKPPIEWSEEEEAQLRDLYEEFREAMDPLGCIMDRLDVKRPKNRIVEKLLEMGLVNDKKELRKKRTKKSDTAHRKSGFNGSDDSDLATASESDDDIQQSSTQSTLTIKKKPSSTRKPLKAPKGKRNTSQSLIPYKRVLQMVSEMESSGMSEAIEWLRESLSDAAEDLEADPEDVDDSGIPLVPILDCAISAMENERFCKLLEGLGVKKPADEQEIYWRIPNDLSGNIQAFLRGDPAPNDSGDEQNQSGFINDEETTQASQKPKKRSQIIDSDDGEDETERNEEEEEGRGEQEEAKSDVQKEPKMSQTRGTGRRIMALIDSDEEMEKVEETPESSSARKALIDGDEEEHPSEDMASNSEQNIEEEPTPHGRKISRIIDSDDEDDNPTQNEETHGKRMRISDSDSETPIKKKTRVIESDEED